MGGHVPHVPRPRPRSVLRVAVIATLIFGITYGHVRTGRVTETEHAVHVLLRAAYLVPILLGAIWYGVTGAVLSASVVSLAFVVHVWTAWFGDVWEHWNQGAMLGVYWILALLAGTLVTLERRADRLRRAAEQRLRREVLVHGLAGLEAALKSRDESTEVHGRNVAWLAAAMARHLGLTEHQVEVVRLAGLVHDLGKIGIRDDVLYKHETLTDAERTRMDEHPIIAERILAAVPGAEEIARVVRAHHEYLDGSGYPDGLRNDDIPLEAQIITAADIFMATTEERAYHNVLSPNEALQLLDSWCPARVRPAIVDALRASLEAT